MQTFVEPILELGFNKAKDVHTPVIVIKNDDNEEIEQVVFKRSEVNEQDKICDIIGNEMQDLRMNSFMEDSDDIDIEEKEKHETEGSEKENWKHDKPDKEIYTMLATTQMIENKTVESFESQHGMKTLKKGLIDDDSDKKEAIVEITEAKLTTVNPYPINVVNKNTNDPTVFVQGDDEEMVIIQSNDEVDIIEDGTAEVLGSDKNASGEGVAEASPIGTKINNLFSEGLEVKVSVGEGVISTESKEIVIMNVENDYKNLKREEEKITEKIFTANKENPDSLVPVSSNTLTKPVNIDCSITKNEISKEIEMRTFEVVDEMDVQQRKGGLEETQMEELQEYKEMKDTSIVEDNEVEHYKVVTKDLTTIDDTKTVKCEDEENNHLTIEVNKVDLHDIEKAQTNSDGNKVELCEAVEKDHETVVNKRNEQCDVHERDHITLVEAIGNNTIVERKLVMKDFTTEFNHRVEVEKDDIWSDDSKVDQYKFVEMDFANVVEKFHTNIDDNNFELNDVQIKDILYVDDKQVIESDIEERDIVNGNQVDQCEVIETYQTDLDDNKFEQCTVEQENHITLYDCKVEQGEAMEENCKSLKNNKVDWIEEKDYETIHDYNTIEKQACEVGSEEKEEPLEAVKTIEVMAAMKMSDIKKLEEEEMVVKKADEIIKNQFDNGTKYHNNEKELLLTKEEMEKKDTHMSSTKLDLYESHKKEDAVLVIQSTFDKIDDACDKKIVKKVTENTMSALIKEIPIDEGISIHKTDKEKNNEETTVIKICSIPQIYDQRESEAADLKDDIDSEIIISNMQSKYDEELLVKELGNKIYNKMMEKEILLSGQIDQTINAHNIVEEMQLNKYKHEFNLDLTEVGESDNIEDESGVNINRKIIETKTIEVNDAIVTGIDDQNETNIEESPLHDKKVNEQVDTNEENLTPDDEEAKKIKLTKDTMESEKNIKTKTGKEAMEIEEAGLILTELKPNAMEFETVALTPIEGKHHTAKSEADYVIPTLSKLDEAFIKTANMILPDSEPDPAVVETVDMIFPRSKLDLPVIDTTDIAFPEIKFDSAIVETIDLVLPKIKSDSEVFEAYEMVLPEIKPDPAHVEIVDMVLPLIKTDLPVIETADMILPEIKLDPEVIETTDLNLPEIKLALPVVEAADTVLPEIKPDPTAVETADLVLPEIKPDPAVIETADMVLPEIKPDRAVVETADIVLPEIKQDPTVIETADMVIPEIKPNPAVVETADMVISEVQPDPVFIETADIVLPEIKPDPAVVETADMVVPEINTNPAVVETADMVIPEIKPERKLDREEIKIAKLVLNESKVDTVEFEMADLAPNIKNLDKEEVKKTVLVPTESKLVIVLDSPSPAANITSSDNSTTISITSSSPSTSPSSTTIVDQIRVSADKVKDQVRISPEDVKFVSCIEINSDEDFEEGYVNNAFINDEKEGKVDILSDEDGEDGNDINCFTKKENEDKVDETSAIDSRMIVNKIITDIVNEDISSHDEEDNVSSEEGSADKADDSFSSIEEKLEKKAVVKTQPTNSKITVSPETKVQPKSALEILVGCFGCFNSQKT